jgi:hypothetical protein
MGCCSICAGTPPGAPGLPGPPGPPPPLGGPVHLNAAFSLLCRDANVVMATCGGVPSLNGGALLPPAVTVMTGLVLVMDITGTDAQMGLIVAGLLLISSFTRSILFSLSLLC